MVASQDITRPAELQAEDLSEMLEEVIRQVPVRMPGEPKEGGPEPTGEASASSSEVLCCPSTMDAMREKGPGASEIEVFFALFLQRSSQPLGVSQDSKSS